jgi:hypothetical protein
MRQVTVNKTPSFASDIGALAGLYRTVFWMIGRKSQYGRIWPREADMGGPEDATGTTELFVAAQGGSEFLSQPATVEVGTRD